MDSGLAMTAPDANLTHRRAVRVLTIAALTLWLVALGAAALVLMLLLRVDAPTSRTIAIVAGWFLTPAVPATAATIALIVTRRSHPTTRQTGSSTE